MTDIFKVQLEWQTQNKPFTYNEYSREYHITAPGKPTLIGTAAPEYKGTLHDYNPEEYLMMALSSCHMLSYLALAANAKITILNYTDNAEGLLHKENNLVKFQRVTLNPQIKLANPSEEQQALALHHKAHKICFIANSVNFPVEITPLVMD